MVDILVADVNRLTNHPTERVTHLLNGGDRGGEEEHVRQHECLLHLLHIGFTHDDVLGVFVDVEVNEFDDGVVFAVREYIHLDVVVDVVVTPHADVGVIGEAVEGLDEFCFRHVKGI